MDMRRYIRLFLLIVGLTFVCAGQANADGLSSDEESRSAAAYFATENSKSLALLTDSSHLLRICSSRPERVNASKEPDVSFATFLHFQNPHQALRRQTSQLVVPLALDAAMRLLCVHAAATIVLAFVFLFSGCWCQSRPSHSPHGNSRIALL